MGYSHLFFALFNLHFQDHHGLAYQLLRSLVFGVLYHVLLVYLRKTDTAQLRFVERLLSFSECWTRFQIFIELHLTDGLRIFVLLHTDSSTLALPPRIGGI